MLVTKKIVKLEADIKELHCIYCIVRDYLIQQKNDLKSKGLKSYDFKRMFSEQIEVYKELGIVLEKMDYVDSHLECTYDELGYDEINV